MNEPETRPVTDEIVREERKPDPVELRASIAAALNRQTEREVREIGIAFQQGTVILTGKVRSWPEKVAATGAVGLAPGVQEVDNRLVVDPLG